MKSQVAGRGVCALARRRAVMESLSPRMLLSVTLTANELDITGTDQDDRISVAATPFINALVVDDNNVRTYYSVGAIKTIIVNAGAGDDRVTVDPALNSLGYDCA